MNTHRIRLLLLADQAARERANYTFTRNTRYAEFKKFYSGGMVVFTGYLLAAIYLLTLRLSN